jgi:DNA-binding XRE family transcriptional regulator
MRQEKQKTFEELRKTGRWSRKLLADKIGVSVQAIHAWERYRSYPTIDKVIKLATVLETTPNEIFNSLIEQKRQQDAKH